jgi:hypothetical protein
MINLMILILESFSRNLIKVKSLIYDNSKNWFFHRRSEYLSIYLSIYLIYSIYLSNYLYLSIYLPTYLSGYLSQSLENANII